MSLFTKQNIPEAEKLDYIYRTLKAQAYEKAV